jgi:hypothetical protein
MAGKVLGAVKVVRARPGVGRTPGNCPMLRMKQWKRSDDSSFTRASRLISIDDI